MDIPSWTPGLAVGEPHLDAQHQALFHAAEKLVRALDSGPTDVQLQEALVFLRRYTLRHFITEEGLLEAVNYPGLTAHRALHARLSTSLLEAESKIASEGHAHRGRELLQIVQALLEHIRCEDQAYVSSLALPESPEIAPATPSNLPVTGFDSIDRDHLCFLGLLEHLHEAVQEGKGDRELPDFLDAVAVYARHHFRREEMLMELVDYPDRQNHMQSHEALLQDLTQLRARLDRGEEGLSEETLQFFRTWLEQHIGHQDLALVPYLQGLGSI